jgi:hypothetical protein
MIKMNPLKYLGGLAVVLLLAACGGGSPDADSATFSVQPNAFAWKDTEQECLSGPIGGVSIHTINGGRQPFRVRVSVSGIEVGLASATDQFVAGAKNAEGDLIVNGRDPRFAVRTTLPCGSDVSVLVLDDTSALISVSIKTERATSP